MTVTAAGPDFDDWPALLALILDSFAYMQGRIDPPSSALRLTSQALAERAAAEHLLLAHDGDRLVGCAFCAEKPDALYVGKLAIAPAAQGQGHGRALIGEAEALARRLGLPRLRLETRVELTGNHAAFAALGFAETRRTAHPGFDRPTSLTMEKPLW